MNARDPASEGIAMKVLLVTALGVIGAVAGGLWLWTGPTPEHQARAFLADATSGRSESAYGRMAGVYRQSHSRAEFREFLDKSGLTGLDSRSLRLEESNTAGLRERVFQAYAAPGEMFEVILVREEGQWRVLALQRAGPPDRD